MKYSPFKIFLLLLSFVNVTIASNVDSLQIKYNLSHDAWKSMVRKNLDSALIIATANVQFAKLLKKDTLIFQSYREKGDTYQEMGDLQNASLYFDSLLQFTNSGNDYFDRWYFSKMGEVNMNLGNLQSSVEYNLKSLAAGNRLQDSFAIGDSYTNLARVFSALKEFDKAIKYSKKNLQYVQPENRSGLFIAIYNTSNYFSQAERWDSSEVYYLKAHALSEELGQDVFKAAASLGLGRQYTNAQDYDQGITYLASAIDIFEKSNNSRGLLSAYSQYAKCLNKTGRNEASIIYYEKGYTLTKNSGLLNQLADLTKSYSEALKDAGKETKAFAMLEEHLVLTDSIRNLEQVKMTNELEEKYQNVQNEKRILEQDIQLNKTQQSRRNILYISIIAGLILFSLFYAQLLRNAKKTNSIQQQDQQIQHLEQQNKILGLSSLIEGQEAERIRIAKDLHDSLGGLLSSVKAHYSKIREELKAVKKIQVFDRAQAMMDEAVDEVRRISHNMMPPTLRVNGLDAAVRAFLENVAESHNLNLVLDIRNMEELIEENKALFVYRIIQELTNNVIKHAAATEIQLQMIRLDDQIQIIFEDNGKGFDYRPDDSGGVGLRSIRSRMDYLGGEIDYTSRSDEGTVVEMMVPC